MPNPLQPTAEKRGGSSAEPLADEEVTVAQVEKSFRMTPSGAFMERRGAGWNEEGRFCQKKLCFVATDQLLLAEVLGQLADRPDCCT